MKENTFSDKQTRNIQEKLKAYDTRQKIGSTQINKTATKGKYAIIIFLFLIALEDN